MILVSFAFAEAMSLLCDVLRVFPGGMRSCLMGNFSSAWVRPWTWFMSG